MSRQIRFRVWDGIDMWYPEDEKEYCLNQQGEVFQLDVEHELEDLIPMLSMVGHDKNYKEIFDGDVVSVMSHDTSFFVSRGDQPTLFRGVVRYEEAQWWVKPINYHNTNPLNDFTQRHKACEVIGNVYENKELMEQQNE